MSKLLYHLRYALGTLLSVSKMETTRTTNTFKMDKPWGSGAAVSPGYSFESLIGAQYHQQIIAQVHNEGFHVESLAIFRDSHVKPVHTLSAIEQWAWRNGLKVAINHEHGICFFEKL